jgi:hypothetical protein
MGDVQIETAIARNPALAVVVMAVYSAKQPEIATDRPPSQAGNHFV